MSISSVGDSVGSYPAPLLGGAQAESAAAGSADSGAAAENSGSVANAVQSSTVVTLSNGQTRTIVPGTCTMTPLSECYGPQMLFQADKNKDSQLNSDEFSTQLKRLGVSTDAALKLFKSFDTSNDGEVSVEEFVNGIKAANASGNDMFQKLTDTYTNDANGKFDEKKSAQFLSDGLALGNQYWASRR